MESSTVMTGLSSFICFTKSQIRKATHLRVHDAKIKILFTLVAIAEFQEGEEEGDRTVEDHLGRVQEN